MVLSFLRLENSDKRLHVAFLFGKARVAPLKQTTIPQMELTAAVLTVRVDRMLQIELQLQLQRSTFWTDSTTVLKYISNETKRFHTFVANRTAVIREATDVEQWRYIGSKENSADEASREMKVDDFLTSKRWIHRPEFLSKPEEKWPKSNLDFNVISSDDPEVKRDLAVNFIAQDTENHINYLINYFSTWMKLKTSVAWFLRLKQLLKLLRHKRQEIHDVISVIKSDPEKQTETLEKALTPNHTLLLKGKPVLPPGLFEQGDLYIRRRWRQLQYIADLFWKRWISEYLTVMQERQKWSRVRRSLTPGDIVINADATAPRSSLIMGKVLGAKPDAKGLVRTVCLQTKLSLLERIVTKVCLLLLEATD